MYQKAIHRRHKFRRIAILLTVLSLVLWISWYLTQNKFDFFEKKETYYDRIIEKAAIHNCLDPCLLKAVIWQESRFKRNSVGSKGEVGLMQLMDGAVADWAKKTKQRVPSRYALFYPKLNIEIGSWYLGRAVKHWYQKGYKDFDEIALCDYNAGRGNTHKWLPKNKKSSIIPNIKFKSTKKYVTSVIEKYHEYLAKRKVK